MKVIGTACLTTIIKMATLREAVANIHCFSVSRDSRHLGLLRDSRRCRYSLFVLSMKIPLAKLADVSKVVNRNRRPHELFIFFLLLLLSFFLLSVSLALS